MKRKQADERGMEPLTQKNAANVGNATEQSGCFIPYFDFSPTHDQPRYRETKPRAARIQHDIEDRPLAAGNEKLMRFVRRRVQGREQKSKRKRRPKGLRGHGSGGMDNAPDEKPQNGILNEMGGFPYAVMHKVNRRLGHVRIQPQQKRPNDREVCAGVPKPVEAPNMTLIQNIRKPVG